MTLARVGPQAQEMAPVSQHLNVQAKVSGVHTIKLPHDLLDLMKLLFMIQNALMISGGTNTGSCAQGFGVCCVGMKSNT